MKSIRILATSLVLLTGAAVARAAPTAPSPPAARPGAPPLLIDLNAFEARKKKAVLSDGVTLAYLQMGDP
ncbi:MAG: hypothetical protein KGI55_06125, partial [Gammaproteobacteria bacterium]|nr:hypothetical protein [Gammaproteobacteria bacterium]